MKKSTMQIIISTMQILISIIQVVKSDFQYSAGKLVLPSIEKETTKIYNAQFIGIKSR